MPVTVDAPESITRSRVQEVLRDLGLGELKDLKSLSIGVRGIEATLFATHPEHGGRYFIPGRDEDGHRQVAEHVVSIALVDD